VNHNGLSYRSVYVCVCVSVCFNLITDYKLSVCCVCVCVCVYLVALVDSSHVHGEVHHAHGVASLVVVIRNQLDEAIVQLDGGLWSV
jgi:hypothetical protein